MKLTLDATVRSLYLRIAPGRVAETIELADLIAADVDESGRTLGIEFIHADDLAPFLREHSDVAVLPSRLTYVSLDRNKAWDVDSGVDEDRPPAVRAATNARLHGEFVADLLADPALVGRIPDGATLTLVPADGKLDVLPSLGLR